MRLQTIVEIPFFPEPIELADRFICIGSCFAESMAGKLSDSRFPVCLNPSGILYNPASIAQLLTRLCQERYYSLSDLIEYNGLWQSLDHHGSFSHPEANEALTGINDAFQEGIETLATANWLILTLGTAYVYNYFITGKPVANCHRLPETQFDRVLLRSPQITHELTQAIQAVRNLNPRINVLLTVSPVRHLRDSAPLNQLSKAQLITSCHSLGEELENCFYFPAYEIVMDELRDYRFFNRDLVHPNELAGDIIWEKFVAAGFSPRAREFMRAHAPLQRAARHRLEYPDTPAARDFKQKQDKLWAGLADKFPEVELG